MKNYPLGASSAEAQKQTNAITHQKKLLNTIAAHARAEIKQMTTWKRCLVIGFIIGIIIAQYGLRAQVITVGPANAITGNGSGLTSLNGANLQSGTVNSNSLDASTKAQLALGGATGTSVGKGLTNISGVLSANGDGSSLVNLNGANLQSGTVNSNSLDSQTKAQLALAGSIAAPLTVNGSAFVTNQFAVGTNAIDGTNSFAVNTPHEAKSLQLTTNGDLWLAHGATLLYAATNAITIINGGTTNSLSGTGWSYTGGSTLPKIPANTLHRGSLISFRFSGCISNTTTAVLTNEFVLNGTPFLLGNANQGTTSAGPNGTWPCSSDGPNGCYIKVIKEGASGLIEAAIQENVPNIVYPYGYTNSFAIDTTVDNAVDLAGGTASSSNFQMIKYFELWIIQPP